MGEYGRLIERLDDWKGDVVRMCKDRQWRIMACVMLWCAVLLCGTAWALMDGIVWPEATGELVSTANKLTIDYSHADQGYVMVHGSPNKGLKLQVETKKGKLLYDINSNEEWEIIPLQLGDGQYTFSLFVPASGGKYASGGKMTIEAALGNDNAPYMIPTQYVYYQPDTLAVAKSDEICAGLTTDQEKFDAIREYIKENYQYDFAKAKSVTTGTLPSVDYAWDTGMGICQDLAALAACMLRVQGIPTRLDIGWVGKQRYYHAWNNVYLNGQFVQYDPTTDVTNNAVPSGQYQLERWY